ncbi:MAG: rpsF [Chloroflexi bacterium]|nr:rpsF [Chloroflexota bacterium]
MRRYELMLVLKPDVAEERTQVVLEKTTRAIVSGGGQVVKAAPWGRRRLAYPIDRYREGSYHILHFEAPPDAIVEVERGLLITEDVLRHLVTRVERPFRAARGRSIEEAAELPPSPSDEEEEPAVEQIDESESEAAPAASD